jgi:iron complex outermembrane recepter protein
MATLGRATTTPDQGPDLAVAVCAACTVTDPRDANGLALIDGNPLPQAPKTTGAT